MDDIEISKYKMVFGWARDNGIGERLIQQILKGEKTATCAPKDAYCEEELKETYEPVGQIVTVYDKENNPRGNVGKLWILNGILGRVNISGGGLCNEN
jgi:uncharacterized protein YhfF